MKNQLLNEITPLSEKDCFILIERKKQNFNFPIHVHQECEINYIENGRGAQRVVGDSVETIDDFELVLITEPQLEHSWFTHECTSNEIYEITIQFSPNLLEGSFLKKTQFSSIVDLLGRGKRGITFSRSDILDMRPILTDLARNKEGFDSVVKFLKLLHAMAQAPSGRTLASSSFAKVQEKYDSRRIDSIMQYSAQNITGKVTDEENEPVIGASVVVVGTTTGSITDADGNYTIAVDKGKTLRFTFIGMKEKLVKVTGTSPLNVVMEWDAVQMDEVVAVGYGFMRKSDLSGAVGGIKGEKMLEAAPISLSQGLQGRISGVMIQQVDGAPGSGVSIEVRGANSFTGGTQPLYVVDDIPYESNSAPGSTANDLSTSSPLSMLNPNDIESVEVLKDASATAIYGSRGANGVVLIRTKQGKAGKAQIDVNLNYGLSVVNRTINVLDAYAYSRMCVEARLNSSLYDVETSYLAQNNVNYLDVYGSRGANFKDTEYYRDHSTNWQDMIFQTGNVLDGTVSISGGSDKITYMVSANFLNQTGILKSSGYSRAGLRINLQGKINQYIKFGVSSNFTWDDNRFVRTGSDVGQQGGVIKSALRYPPVYNAYTEVGDVADEWYDASNPLTYVLSQKNDVVNSSALPVNV